jgi:transposase
MSNYKGTEFYRRIADLCLSGVMSHPEIAEAYGVNATTVARWARVCRDLDLLPATYRGRKYSYGTGCPMCGAPKSARNPNQVRPPYAPTA